MAIDKQAVKDRLKDGFSVMKEKAAVIADDECFCLCEE